MLASIRGILLEKTADAAVIESGGVGFEIQVGARTLASLPEAGKEAMLYTYLQVREDAMVLYGFTSADEKHMFLKLIAVSGVGPKVGMSILSSMTVHEIAVALVTGDAKAIARVPGIGKKTAERLILELKERVDNSYLVGSGQDVPAVAPVQAGSPQQEAVDALMALGYSSAEASRAVSHAPKGLATVEEIIVAALSALDRGR